jgi:membrane protein
LNVRLKIREFVVIAKKAFRQWQAHKPAQRASALAFLTIFPLPSVLMITVAIFNQIYGQTGAFNQVIAQIAAVAGPAVAELFRQVLENARNPFATVFIAVLSVPLFLIGAVVAFSELQESLNAIWDVVPAKHMSIWEIVRNRIVPFLVFSGLAILTIVWTAVTTVSFSFIRVTVGSSMGISIMLEVIDILLSFFLVALLFAVIYKRLPDVKIAWRDVKLAAVLSALLFTVSKYIFEIYIQAFVATSVFGAAGSLLLLLLWIFLVAQFLLFGAEFSNVYAETLGSHSEQKKSMREQR